MEMVRSPAKAVGTFAVSDVLPGFNGALAAFASEELNEDHLTPPIACAWGVEIRGRRR